jgi:hypothetical protein
MCSNSSGVSSGALKKHSVTMFPVGVSTHTSSLVAYLGAADNSRGPLLSRLRGLSPPVVRSQNGLSAPYAALLSCLSTHRSCLLTYRSRAVGRFFAWFIRYRTWGCGQGGTR